MIKANVDMKNAKLDLECSGSATSLCGEILSMMGYIYATALSRGKKNFAEEFKELCVKISNPLLSETVFEHNPWIEETIEIESDESE